MTARRLGLSALLAALVVTAPAFAAPHAGGEPGRNVAYDPVQELANARKSVVVVTRSKSGALNAKAAAPALSVDAFSATLGRTFAMESGRTISHTEPVALPAKGAVTGGFIASVKGYGGRCGFAIGGLDFSGNGGAEGLNAMAAVIFCAGDADGLAELAEPDRILRKLARIPRE